MKTKAVLFDFDGVIANTVEYHVAAWTEAFAGYNVEIEPEDIFFQEGQMADFIAPNLAKMKGLDISEDKLRGIIENKRAIYKRTTRAQVYPQTKELVEKLKNYPLKLAIVTGSILPNMEVVAGKEFLAQFDAIVTGDSVSRNKPFPEPFLSAAKKLALRSEECVVIENAPLGIQAAKKAGMFCVAVQTTIKDKEILQQADVVFSDLSEIPMPVILEQIVL
ncbi:MAG: HAD family phosphatase [Calditrichaeota bacterium]|nr:HAD family phosphatase [Calditrichota bacterium]